MSFRTRLLLTSLSVLALGLGMLVLAGNVLLRDRVDLEARDLLSARAQAQIAALGVNRGRVRVRKTANDAELDQDAWVFVRGRALEHPPAASATVDQAAAALVRGQRDVGDVRLRAFRVRSGVRVVAAVSVAPFERLEQEVLVGSLAIAGLILVAGALAISAALAGALRPVAAMTESAEEWGAHDLERRFDLGPPRDELTGLAATLDHLLARIAASRRHEQRFASEVAHELRTPVAALRGQAELGLTGDPDAALRDVIASADRLDGAIDTLLAVARQDFAERGGEVDLAEVVAGLDVAVTAPDDLPRAEGDPAVVARALAPLIDNARRHARERVCVELSAVADRVLVAVRDDGPGVDPALGDRVFEPGVRAGDGDGAGLGLPLARRLARACGGDVRRGDGPGGCFVLELPAV